MRSAKFAFVATLLTVMLGLAACNIPSDVRSNTYKNYESLVTAGEIERGWAPKYLPLSASKSMTTMGGGIVSSICAAGFSRRSWARYTWGHSISANNGYRPWGIN